MTKRLIILFAIFLLATGAYAQQWTSKDSLNPKRMVGGGEELKLNPEAIKLIDLGTSRGTPRMAAEKRWSLPDETLPEGVSKPKFFLSLFIYKPTTPFNWDPVNERKIRVRENTWRMTLTPSGKSEERIKRSDWKMNNQKEGINFRLLSERANGIMVGTPVIDPMDGINLGSGMYMSGGTIGGLDLMTVFTKEFWDKKGRERRVRTLELLEAYGDSTTVFINQPLKRLNR